ncbi:DUF4344 domain-containing metallopeptidase [Marivita sp. GX14005]|uniref:DUF4344 domain-containing metallopeptidase n=1 Tax=Marivita sp. GX14005 TaxID=2942276 RepID=UPI002018D2A9|nr:DUF4344 domain-containing metallopeptidase [Marivita sp. GX14005]
MKRFALCATLIASAAAAGGEEDAFVEANVLGIFFHELAHAIIDVMHVPIYAREEDAADVASVVLIEEIFKPDIALDLAYHIAEGFRAEAQRNAGRDLPVWGVHGLDAQRFYNMVCLFYGAEPEARAGFARDMGLPSERAESCAEEYDLAFASWAAVLDDLNAGQRIELQSEPPNGLFAQVLVNEIEALTDEFTFPGAITVNITRCGNADAFYDPEDRTITICTELDADLRELYRHLD